MSKHIYIYSPSSAVRDKAAFKRGVKRLEAQGHEVEIDEAALAVHQRFAGDDSTRLAAIGRAAASGADIAMTTRGGYGLTRILDAIPYENIAKAIERGTAFVGFSDFTALQNALLAKTGAITWAGPSVGEDFGTVDAPDDIMEACFHDLLDGHGEGTGWRLPAREGNAPCLDHVRHAKLWGGNLTVITSLIGTRYFPEIHQGVLFLEDVGEHPYRVERMLDQLRHAGILQRQHAILLGQFTAFRKVPNDQGFGLASVSTRLQSLLKVPVLTGLPFGHVPTKVLLPVGAKVDMQSQGREVLMMWGHTHTASHAH
ncbi:MAG: LD-carboxypeptidase [Cytophagaceae bacterium]|nr:MAG: LD-carboxypeptidase [Cytophagaceae bacterium]